MAFRPSVLSISPILAVRDVEVSVAFYGRYLGFQQVFVMEDFSYGVVAFDGQSIHFTRAEDRAAERATRARLALYIAVRGIDALWQRLLTNPPPTRVRALETTPWGMREFHVMDPDGCLLRFGEEQG
ncbi:bleomycin resistance protein [Pararhodospirillum oryzae]|uniref:Bleomycin resistance protein n=1 Tax=Pararhodospirillum oryzae TaxID=478448 RepID=A0A512H5K5_9PROT|nr:VOC family protein [Pararhodospirillum oryzae]GEO80711.1 glyoxalase [Pararhodospirillum oryzae]